MINFKKFLVDTKLIGVDHTIKYEIVKNNTKRFFYSAAFLFSIHLFFIVYYLIRRATISNDIFIFTNIIAHSVMLIMMLISGYALYISKFFNGRSLLLYRLLFAVAILYLCFGATVSLLANMIAPNLTAYIITCLSVAVFFVINPVVMAIHNTVIYIVFSLLVQFFQNDSFQIASQRVDCFAVTLVSIFISLVLWAYNIKDMEQQKKIEAQNIELMDKYRATEYHATHDELTGILNRTYFQQIGETEINQARLMKREICIVMVDIDHFKNINDKYGHPIGDSVLKEFADLLTNSVRKTDRVARWGGEEFILLLPNMNIQEAEEKAESIRIQIESHKFLKVLEKITASFGVVKINLSCENPTILFLNHKISAHQ